MKKIIVVASFLSTVLTVKSQNLTVEGTSPNLYITHTVAPKENFYSVGRLYNQNPKSIAAFNSLVMEKGLTIGQHIKIPLNEQNLDVNGKPATGETFIPLTHIVTKSETISKLATDNSVSAQNIKQWNHLSSDNIAPGTPLVVGHLKMSSSASIAKTTSASGQPVAPKQETVSEAKKEEVSTPVAQLPVVEKKETATVAKQEAVKPVETSVPVKETPVKGETVKTTPAKADDTKKSDTYSYSSTGSLSSPEGAFSNLYSSDASQKSITTKSGEAATFKSTSGWQDRKYYVLMNDIPVGTIIKIASTENKVIYARVLGSMPDMKENNGLLIRISNAAASYLGIIDPKFPVQVSYYQ